MEECPYCLNPILETEEVTTCRVCGTPYHAECIEENGGCALKDCEERVRPEPVEITVDAEPKTVLVLSKESVEKATPAAPLRKQSNPCLKCGKQLPLGEIYCEECTPITADDIDSKNWKLILVLVVLIGLIAWLAIWLFTPQQEDSADDVTSGQVSRTVHH